jgi:general stress protein YciG
MSIEQLETTGARVFVEGTTETSKEAEESAPKSKRGFAAMDLEKRREIASKGGRAAHALGKAHHFTGDEAREAGKKGGNAVSRNREHMIAIGRAGGLARGARKRAKAAPVAEGEDSESEPTRAAS